MSSFFSSLQKPIDEMRDRILKEGMDYVMNIFKYGSGRIETMYGSEYALGKDGQKLASTLSQSQVVEPKLNEQGNPVMPSVPSSLEKSGDRAV